MNSKRWNYLKSLQLPAPRLVWKSAKAWMQRHPLDLGQHPTMPLVPMIERPGHTFCENRNARKQANRENARRNRAA
jgi:hypothetical protein